jgi:hypothetical protein
MIAHPRRAKKDVKIMDEFPKKTKTYSKDLYTGIDLNIDGSGRCLMEIPVEWDTLVDVSDRCMMRRIPGFVERKVVIPMRAGVLWQLSTEDLGDLGTLEILKIRPKWSRITFSGLAFLAGYPDKRLECEQYIRNIIKTYFFMLSEENIFPEPDGPLAGQETEPEPEPEKGLRQKGRYRLTPEEIKVRTKQVREAKKLKKSDPSLGWKEIARTLGVPERTLRDWRHNPLY